MREIEKEAEKMQNEGQARLQKQEVSANVGHGTVHQG